MDEDGNLLLADFDWLYQELTENWIQVSNRRAWGVEWQESQHYCEEMQEFAWRYKDEFNCDLFYIHMPGTPYERSFRDNVTRLIRTLNEEAREEFLEEERMESFRRGG